VECDAECHTIHKDVASHCDRSEDPSDMVSMGVIIFVVMGVTFMATDPLLNEVENQESETECDWNRR
jgi:hypothetical protein